MVQEGKKIYLLKQVICSVVRHYYSYLESQLNSFFELDQDPKMQTSLACKHLILCKALRDQGCFFPVGWHPTRTLQINGFISKGQLHCRLSLKDSCDSPPTSHIDSPIQPNSPDTYRMYELAHTASCRGVSSCKGLLKGGWGKPLLSLRVYSDPWKLYTVPIKAECVFPEGEVRNWETE